MPNVALPTIIILCILNYYWQSFVFIHLFQLNTLISFSCIVPERSPTNISAITVNSTHLNISFAFLPEDIEVWNSFELKNYHLSVTEIFLPQFIKETMNRTIPKNISQVIFGPIEEDREYSIWIAGVTQLGLGVKSEKVCIRTHQASKLILLLIYCPLV